MIQLSMLVFHLGSLGEQLFVQRVRLVVVQCSGVLGESCVVSLISVVNYLSEIDLFSIIQDDKKLQGLSIISKII